MKKYIIIIFTLFTCFWADAQTADITEGCVPLEVKFTSTALSAYYWEFKDGTTSDEMNPSKVFINPGEYQVELYEGVGGPLIGTITISVFEDPVVQFDASSMSGCSPFQVSFTNTSIVDDRIDVTGYFWDFGDGTNSNLENPTHVYFNEGTFTVTLRIETADGECTITEIFSDFITVAGNINAGFITDESVICETPATFNITNNTQDGAGYTYQWDFGNGENSNDYAPGSVTYDDDGQYTITLVVDNGAGCEVTLTRTIQVGPPLIDINFPDTVCINENYQIINFTDANGFQWTFGDDADPSQSNLISPVVSFSESGPQLVSLSAIQDANCKSDTFFTVFVEDPSAAFTVDPVVYCADPTTYTFTNPNANYKSYLWEISYPNQTFENEGNILQYVYDEQFRDSFYISRRDTFKAYLTVETFAGCVAEDSLEFYHRAPRAHFIPDVSRGCAPLTINFDEQSLSDQPIDTWTWDFGDGSSNTVNNPDDMTHTFANPGEYAVQLIIENEEGCKDTSEKVIIYVGEKLSSDFTIDKSEICLYDEVNFSVDSPDPRVDAYHFSTDENRISHCYTSTEASHEFIHTPGVFPVTLTLEYNGCYNTIDNGTTITVNGSKSRIKYMTNCVDPYTVMLQDSSVNASSSIWIMDGDTINMDTVPTNPFNFTFDDRGSYDVLLITEDDSDCDPDTAKIKIHIRDLETSFELPEKICANEAYELNSSQSIDVDTTCSKGFLWDGVAQRPRQVSSSSIVAGWQPGPFQVRLITEDINGCRDTLIKESVAYEAYPDFATDKERICFPSEVEFSDLTSSDTTIVEWNWSFGSEDQNTSYTFNGDDGSLDPILVQLVTTDALGCKDSIQKFLEVYEPTTQISFDPSNVVCVGETINFTATDFTDEGSFLNFNWQFGNQNSMEQNPSFDVNNPGINNLILTITEDSTGCSTEYTQNIQGIAYPIADFETDPDNTTEICYPAIIQFNNNSTIDGPGAYFWDFGNGNTNNVESPSSSFDKGTFDIELIAASVYGCNDTINKSITLVGPEGTFITDKTKVCKGEAITFTMVDTVDVTDWTWDFGDGTVIEDDNPVPHTFNFHPPDGTTNVSLILKSSENGCEYIVNQPVEIFKVIADFNALEDSIYCLGEAEFINNSIGATDYFWDFGNGETTDDVNTSFNYEEPGQYFVTLAISDDISGCVDTLTKEISIQPIPEITVQGDTICESDSMRFFVISDYNPLYNYELVPNDDFVTINGSQIFLSDNASGEYTIVATDPNGCEGEDVAELLVIDSPEPFTNFDTILLQGSQVELPFTLDPSLYSFSWNNVDGLSCTDCYFPTVTPQTDSISYIATVIDNFGCSTRTWTFTISVLDRIVVPTVFSPNGDMVNDNFDIIIKEKFREYVDVVKLKVYNRWGNIVYDNALPATGWDGRYDNGDIAPAEVYVYILEVNYINGEAEFYKGTVTLIK